ncbi:bacteriocin [Streptococcus suis]|uniref:Blp family class II bacteriocin n=1 Tax=Streptococcus suis TaxID=1307 RepID=UPI00376B332A
MNTKTFNTMNEEMLAQVEGGGGKWLGYLAEYIVTEIVGSAADYSTESCRKNPKQWFCIKVG